MLIRNQNHPDVRTSKYGLITLLVLFGVGLIFNLLFPSEKPKLDVSSVELLYPVALEKALEWEDDAQLTSVTLWIRQNHDVINMYHNSFAFESPKTHKYLLVFINDEFPEYEVDMKEGDINTDKEIKNPISIEDLKFDSDVALDLLLENGGEGFISRHSLGVIPNSLILRRLDFTNGTGPVHWRLGLSGLNSTLYIYIDADNGELIKIRAYGRKEQELFFGDDIKIIRLYPGEWVTIVDEVQMKLGEPYPSGLSYKANLSIKSAVWNTNRLEAGYGWETQLEWNDITVITARSDYFEMEVLPVEKWYQTIPEGTE